MKNRQTALNIAVLSLLAALVLIVFRDVIFSGTRVALRPYSEAFANFIPNHIFYATEIRTGHLPLFCPFVYCGYPFPSWTETAVFYPLSLIYVILPVVRALNLDVILHLVLGGYFMYFFARKRGIGAQGSALAAVLFIFSAPQFLYAAVGDYTNVNTFIWAPLVLAAADGMTEGPSLKWVMTGAAAIAMQVFAGHIQVVYYTALAAFSYLIAKMLLEGIRPIAGFSALGKLFLSYFMAAALTSVQLLPTLFEVSRGSRGAGVTRSFAAICSFPPENMLTFFAPGMFGDTGLVPYWGRWLYWEVTMFVGIAGLVMAVLGAIWSIREKHGAPFAAAAICLVLAMGVYTPLFDLFFGVLPGYNLFRGCGKFGFLVTLFLSILAGMGFDGLLSGTAKHDGGGQNGPEKAVSLKTIAVVLYIVGIVLFLAASFIRSPFSRDVSDFWRELIFSLPKDERGPFFAMGYNKTAEFARMAGLQAWRGLVIAGSITFLLAGIFLAMKRTRKAVYALAVIAAAEVIVFALHERAGMPFPDRWLPPKIMDVVGGRDDEGRTLIALGDRYRENLAMVDRFDTIWGMAPPSRRFSEFMFFTQGMPPSEAGGFVVVKMYDPLYRIVRCRYVVTSAEMPGGRKPLVEDEGIKVYEVDGGLPRVFVAEKWREARTRDNIFAIMRERGFDPGKEVILEEDPFPDKLVADNGGRGKNEVSWKKVSLSALEVTAKLESPAVLVVTDAYDPGWRARDLYGTKEYKLIPADYILQAVPLMEGEHHFVLEYRPFMFVAGAVISMAAWMFFIPAFVFFAIRTKKA